MFLSHYSLYLMYWLACSRLLINDIIALNALLEALVPQTCTVPWEPGTEYLTVFIVLEETLCSQRKETLCSQSICSAPATLVSLVHTGPFQRNHPLSQEGHTTLRDTTVWTLPGLVYLGKQGQSIEVSTHTQDEACGRPHGTYNTRT